MSKRNERKLITTAKRIFRALGSTGNVYFYRRLLLIGAAVVFAIALAFVFEGEALARPGGGHSYSGRSSGGGGSGGDGLGILIWFLLRLCIEHPVIGIPLTIVVIVVFVVSSRIKQQRSDYQEWSSGAGGGVRHSQQFTAMSMHDAGLNSMLQQSQVGKARLLDLIRFNDPNFSTVLFEDFLYALYTEVQVSRGGARIERMSAYLTPQALTPLKQHSVAEVTNVIVGAMRVTNVVLAHGETPMWQVVVNFEANYEEKFQPGGKGQAYYVSERWILERATGVRSRTPQNARMIVCPNCGAPIDMVQAGRCSHCGQQVNNGFFDWAVQNIEVWTKETRGPVLTSNVSEQGTNQPTVFDTDLLQQQRAFMSRDPQFDLTSFQNRIVLIFSEFQKAWTARNLKAMRPFLSDTLFEVQMYWINEYLKQGLQNITQGARITHMEVVRVMSDAFYDAITVRLWATGLDYTVQVNGGRVVQGNTRVERPYSEYWTLIRAVGRTGPAQSAPVCPNCGAPLSVNMAGHCDYCKTKVTTGQFDWVLSKIEQDESYGR